MHSSIRSRLVALVRGQWAGLLALFLVTAGGTAYAVDTVGSSDIIDGQVKTADIGNSQVYSADVRNDTQPNGGLTGADIKDNSGVDTCPSPATVQLGRICAGSDGTVRAQPIAVGYCSSLGLRLPSFSEAYTMATNYDVPGIGESAYFWTDEELYIDGFEAKVVSDDGGFGVVDSNSTRQTVCVTTPAN
jgi:hypothetical protein